MIMNEIHDSDHDDSDPKAATEPVTWTASLRGPARGTLAGTGAGATNDTVTVTGSVALKLPLAA
jgi:hypothetical protein